MRLKACALAMALSLPSGQTLAAAPDFTTRGGELACVGLVGIGLAGASASQPFDPRLESAMSMAFGFYLGRASKLQPVASKREVDQAIAKLTLQERNAYVDLCLKKSVELMTPIVD